LVHFGFINTTIKHPKLNESVSVALTAMEATIPPFTIQYKNGMTSKCPKTGETEDFNQIIDVKILPTTDHHEQQNQRKQRDKSEQQNSQHN
jgi:hypothetical protein